MSNRPASTPRSAPAATPNLPPLNLNAAAIDIGATAHFVAVPPGRAAVTVRAFATFTADLHCLADWLKQCEIDTVVMESTGVFWIPVFELLEQRGFTVLLAWPTPWCLPPDRCDRGPARLLHPLLMHGLGQGAGGSDPGAHGAGLDPENGFDGGDGAAVGDKGDYDGEQPSGRVAAIKDGASAGTEGLAAEGTAIALLGVTVDTNVAFTPMPPCPTIRIRAKYLVRVHRNLLVSDVNSRILPDPHLFITGVRHFHGYTHSYHRRGRAALNRGHAAHLLISSCVAWLGRPRCFGATHRVGGTR